MLEGFTRSACNTVVRAQQTARSLGHDTAVPTDLLLGIVESNGPAPDGLRALGVSPKELGQHLTRRPRPATTGKPLAEETEQVLRQARIEAAVRRHTQIRLGHVIIALMGSDEIPPALRSVGSTTDQVRFAVLPRLALQER